MDILHPAFGRTPPPEATASDRARLPALRPHLELVRLGDQVDELIVAAKAPATLRAYRTDWQAFTAWCAARGLQPLPAAPETVALYVADHADRLAVATLARRLTSISQAHQVADLESPTKTKLVREAMKGVRRRHGVAQVKKQPLRTADVRKLVATLDPEKLIGLRDRALLVVGFAGAFRRSELVALDVGDVRFDPDGLVVRIRRSKTDQEGKGASIGLPFGSDPATCPVRTLRAWLDAADIEEGPIFVRLDEGVPGGRMSDRAAAERVKMACARAGLDASRYGGHSLRSGLITSAIERGASEHRTMQHSRHRSVQVFRGYVRDTKLLDGANPAAKVGL